MAYKLIIGLEVHVELNTKSKMFCSCSAEHFNVPPNTHTCPTCLGLPGALPTVNKEACERSLQIGLALNCSLLEKAVFARKHYAYPDLAKGYQISQYDLPFCVDGWIEIAGRKIRIKRVHMEEDTGKLQHGDFNGANASFVDFNRSGVPLVEIVTEADFRSPEEVEEYAKTLQRLMRYLGVSTADMDKGSMRFEANISLLNTDNDISGYLEDKDLPKFKVEVKNLNSFKAVSGAIKYEAIRQQALLEKGKVPAQETLGWDDSKQKTYTQREKEDAHDYRYFPDPDISPMEWMKHSEKELISQMPELPWNKKARYTTALGLSEYDGALLTEQKEIAEFFEEGVTYIKVENKESDKVVSLTKKLANWINGELARLRNETGLPISQFKVTSIQIVKLITLIESQKISQTNAKVVFQELFTNGGDIETIITTGGLEQVTDNTVVTSAVSKVIAEQGKAVEDYKSGKETVIQYLIGMTMKELKGKGSTEVIKEELKKQLCQ